MEDKDGAPKQLHGRILRDILERSAFKGHCNYKGMDFLKLKEGNKIVANYTVKCKILNKDNSRDQSLLVNQVKKFLREDVQVHIKLVSLKVEKGVIVVDICNLPSDNRVSLSIDLVPYIGPLPQHRSTTLASREEVREYEFLAKIGLTKEFRYVV
ncbi:hypothetical protein CR513_27253, partial [Mucuna pruriens]